MSLRPGDAPRNPLARIGTAGWSLPRRDWPSFPPEGSHLERYAQVFPATEINSSFYRPHRRETYARWAASVPETFRFAVKLPRRITHELRLKESEDAIDGFRGEIDGLGEKRGPVLVQLPPSLRFDETTAAAFLAQLTTRISGPVVWEARHPSWFEPAADAMLDDFAITRVLADPPLDARPPRAAPLVYRRLHGSPKIYYSPYPPEALDEIAARIRSETEQGIESWSILDNTAEGFATGDALRVLRHVAAAGLKSD